MKSTPASGATIATSGFNLCARGPRDRITRVLEGKIKSFPEYPTHPTTRRRPICSKGFGGAESLIVASSRTRGASIGVQLPGPPKPESAGPAPNRPRVAAGEPLPENFGGPMRG